MTAYREEARRNTQEDVDAPSFGLLQQQQEQQQEEPSILGLD